MASTEFTAGERVVKVGESVDWKKLGITEQIAFDWWRSGMVSHPEGAAAEAEPPAADVEDLTVAAVIADVVEDVTHHDEHADESDEADEDHPSDASKPRTRPKKPTKKH